MQSWVGRLCTTDNYAPVMELADMLRLERSASACRFESCQEHQSFHATVAKLVRHLPSKQVMLRVRVSSVVPLRGKACELRTFYGSMESIRPNEEPPWCYIDSSNEGGVNEYSKVHERNAGADSSEK